MRPSMGTWIVARILQRILKAYATGWNVGLFENDLFCNHLSLKSKCWPHFATFLKVLGSKVHVRKPLICWKTDGYRGTAVGHLGTTEASTDTSESCYARFGFLLAQKWNFSSNVSSVSCSFSMIFPQKILGDGSWRIFWRRGFVAGNWRSMTQCNGVGEFWKFGQSIFLQKYQRVIILSVYRAIMMITCYKKTTL